MVGSFDLKASLGLLGEDENNKIKQIIDEIAFKTKKHKVILSAVAGNNLKSILEWIDRGANIIRIKTDVSLLRNSVFKMLTEIKD